MQKPLEIKLTQQKIACWLWPGVLNLDAACVAVLWNILLTKVAAPDISPVTSVLLGLAVWAIYLFDHLLDTREILPRYPEPRRKVFFREHRTLMVTLLVSVAAVGLALVHWSVNSVILRSAWQAGPLTGIYLASVHLLPGRLRPQWPREIAVALVFCLGVCAPAWWSGHSRHAALLAFVVPFFLLCWFNCCAVEIWDWKAAGQPTRERPNFVASYVERHLGVASIGVLLTALLLALRAQLPWPLLEAILISGASLGAISTLSTRLNPTWRAALADLALCSPIVVLPSLW